MFHLNRFDTVEKDDMLSQWWLRKALKVSMKISYTLSWLAEDAPGNFHFHRWVYVWGLHVCTVNCPMAVSKHNAEGKCWSCPESGRNFHCYKQKNKIKTIGQRSLGVLN